MAVYDYALLIERYTDEIKNVIAQNSTVIIKGPTGCGKSTYIPLLYRGFRVAIVEPRRIAVSSLYNVLAPHIPNLGYKMRFNKKQNAETKVTIFTDGCFLNDITAADYDYIIIDEVHERSVRTDIILAMLRADYKNKLILMSASIDTTKLEAYFGAKTYEIPGKSNPVEIRYLEHPTSDYIVEAYLTVKKILKTREASEKKDILVFLPGEEDINELGDLCRKIPSIAVYKIHSSMSDKDQQKIYASNNLTRVVLSTNICETSLTIPNIKYVIDTGLCKVKVFDGINHLGIQSINRDSAVQRLGRCNRIGPGVCYRLYTEFELLPGYVPEILRCDLSTAIMQIIHFQKNLLALNLLDYPPAKNCKASLEFLLAKNCIECFYRKKKVSGFSEIAEHVGTVRPDGTLLIDYSVVLKGITFRATSYGRRLVGHPFDIHLAHFYEQCISAGLGYYASLLLALISQENCNFLNPLPKTWPDILYLINLLEKYKEAGDRQKYCIKHSVSYKGMELACSINKALNKSKDGNADELERIFSNSFKHNLCIRKKDGSFVMERSGTQVYIHPSSAFFKRNDTKIVVVDLFCTTKTYARIVGRYIE